MYIIETNATVYQHDFRSISSQKLVQKDLVKKFSLQKMFVK